MEENAIGMPDSFFERLNKKNGFADDTTAAPVDSGTTPVATDKTIPSGMPDSFFEKLNSQQHYADTNNWAENYKRYIPQAEENPSAWDNIKNNFFAIKDASEASMYGGLELMSRQGEKSGNANFANFIKAAGMYYGADPNWLVKNMQENEAQSQEELKRVWLDPKMGQFNATDMFADPKSFFQTQLPQMLGGSATLMAAGMGIAKGVQTGVMALGAAGAPFTFGGSAVAAGFIGGAVASAISRPIESLMEGYGAFDEAYSELAKKYPNATHQQLTDMAMPVFNKTFDENMQLQVLDAVQIGLSIIPVTAWGKGALSGTGAIGRMARRADMMRQRYNVAAHIGETAFQMGTEGWEEGRQMQITNEAINKYVGTDKPTSWYDMLNTKEGQSAVSGGAFMGGMMESPGILKLAYNKLTGVGDDIKTKPYEDIKQKQTALFYGNIAKSVNEGTTNEMMQAINKFGRSGVLATVETDDADSRNKSSIAEAKRLGDEVAEQVGVFSRMKEQYPDVSEKGLVRMFQNNALIRNNANALKTLSEDNVTDAPIIQRINAQNEALNKENNDIIAGKDVWETPSHEDPFADPEKDKEADIPFDSVEEVEAARLKEIEALQQIPTDGMTDEQMYQRAESLAEINSRYEDLKNRLTEKINDAKGHYENQRVLTEMLQNNIPVEGTIQKAYGMHYDFVTQDGKTVRFYNQATHDVVDDNDFNGSAFLVLRKAEQGLDGTYKDEKGNYLFRSVLGDKDHAERIEVHTTDKDGNDKYLGNVAVSNAEDYNIARDRAKAARMEKLEGEDGEGEGFSVSDEQLSGVKTTSNEQAAEAQSYGFRNAYHALNSVNKYFDADYTDYANIPKEDLALVGRIKQEEAASATTTTPPPDSPPDSPPPSEPDTPPAPPTPPPTPPPAPQSPSPASAPSGTTSSTDSGNAGYERTERSFDKVNVGDNITHNGKQGKVFAKVRPKGSLSHPVVLAKDAEGVVFRVSESEYKGTERGESDNVLKTNGKLVSYRNDIGRIVVDEENNVIFEGSKSSVELGKTTDEEFAAKSIGDIGISYVNENSLDQAILVGDTVYVKGEEQELVRINYDKNGNVVSYTYKNSKGQERTNRNYEAALDVAIQKNNQEFDKSRKGASDEVKQRDEEHISGVVKAEYGDSIGYILETMPDEVYDTFDLMESGVTSLEKDAIQYMVLRTIEALADARKRIEGSNATKKEKGSALSMIEKFEKDLNKYYGKLDQQGKVSAKDVAKANTGENNKGVNTVQDADKEAEREPNITAQDNIEQEPNIKAIESESESEDEHQLVEAEKQAEQQLKAANVFVTPIADLSVDPQRFQPREDVREADIEEAADEMTKDYSGQEKESLKKKIVEIIRTTTGSLKTIKSIVEAFDGNVLDAIKTWKDPENGNTYVANHSRLSAHKILSILPDTDQRVIRAKENGFEKDYVVTSPTTYKTEEEFKSAAQESNNKSTQNTDIENANIIRGWTGLTKTALREKARDLFGDNALYFMNLASLNLKGKVMNMLQGLQRMTDKQQKNKIESIADWIGEARRTIYGLTDAHENEMFDFLFNEDLSKRITTKADFLQKVRSVLKPMTPDEPLNLARFKQATTGEQAYEEEEEAKKAEMAAKQASINKINDRFANPAREDYISTESKDYAAARKIADEKIAKLDAERQAIQKQLEDLRRQRGKYFSAPTTGSLFDKSTDNAASITQAESKTLTDHLNKAFGGAIKVLGLDAFNARAKELGIDARLMTGLWHGSPHDFDAFDLSKIGTGEGAQAFGWGLYFTDLKSIAETYANSLSNNKFEIAKESLRASVLSDVEDIIGKPLTAMQKAFIKNLVRFDYNTQRVWLNKPNTAELFVAATVANTGYNFGDGYREWEIFKDVLPKIQDYDQTFEKDRNLYKVSLHKGKTPDQYTWLEWDKPVSDENLKKIGYELEIVEDNEVKGFKYGLKLNGEIIYRGVDITDVEDAKNGQNKGRLIYKNLSRKLGGDKQASLFLLENGIDGIKYPAESISRGATSDTARGFNYVVFDDKALSIEEKIQFLKTSNGTVYGAVLPDGSMYLNPEKLNANTPIHEHTHLFNQVIQHTNPELWGRMVAAAKEIKLWNEVKNDPNYSNLKTDNQIADEVYSRLTGKKGAINWQARIAKAYSKSRLAKIGELIKEYWNAIKEFFGADVYKGMSADDFANMTLDKLFGGKEIKGARENIDSNRVQEKSVVKKMMVNGNETEVRTLPQVTNGFYSPIEKKLLEEKATNLSATKWLERLGKGDEMVWTGLKDFLESKRPDEQVKKAELQAFVKDNRIEVVEVVKGEVSNFTKEDIADVKINQHGAGNWVVKTKEDGTVEFPLDKADDKAEAIEYALEQLNYDNKSKRESKPKFQQYQLEGEKENYREVLVTMPSERSKIAQRRSELAALDRERPLTSAEQKEYDDLQKKWKKDEGVFRSSHFDEPNILVHLRMSDRIDSEGNKVLHLSEIQSDWGQKGKKEGFNIPAKKNEFRKEKQSDGSWVVKDANNTAWWHGSTEERADAVINEYNTRETRIPKEVGAIPNAPFVTDTNQWVKLGLKTALKYAVKSGATKITWETGETQNARYDLSKQVDWINAEKTNKGDYKIEVGHKDNRPMETQYLKENELEANLGKELATKIINDGGGMYKGLDLKVGGKGMKGFYGEPSEGKEGIVGKVAKALVKELTGKPAEIVETKVKLADKLASGYDVTIKDENGRVTIHNFDTKSQGLAWLSKQKNIEVISEKAEGIETSTQHSIEITPELKAEVQKGMPLFQRANAQYRVAAGQRLIEALKDFNGSREATTAIIHEIMHPTVETIITGAKEGNVVGQKHTKTIVEEYNKANPDNKVTEEELIADNDKFVNGETTDKYRAVQEFIAEQWERYHQEGAKGFSKSFQEVLDAISEAFRSVYKSLTGEQLTPELRKMFDDILGKEELSTDETTPTKEGVSSNVGTFSGESNSIKYQIEEFRDEPLSSVNPALAEYIRQRMQRLFPSVALFSDKASFEAAAKKVSKGVTFSSAYIGAAIKNMVYVDAEKALQHTEIHEYAHIYWDALPADHPLKTALLDKFGGNEEAAIDAIGRAGTIIMENELDIAKSGFFEKWLKKFWAAVKGVFTSKSIEQAFAERLLTNADEVTEENITSGVVKYMKMKSSAKYSELSEKAVKGIEKIIGKKISSLTFPEYYKHISTEIKPNDFKQWKMLSPQKFLEKMYGIVSPVSTLSPSNKAVFMKQYREYLDDYNWAENNVWTRFASGSMTLTVKEIEDLYMEAYKRKSYGTKDAVNFLADLYSKAVMYKNMQQEIKGDTFNKPFAKISFDMMSGHEITDLSGSEFVSGKYSLLSPDRVKETILQGREKLYREVQRNATIKEDALKNDFDAIWKRVKDLKSDLRKIVDKTGTYFIDRNSSAYKALRGGTAADRALADLLDMHYKYESAYGGLSMEKGKYRVPVARMDFGGLAKKFGFKEGMRRYFAKPSKYDNVIIDVRSLGLSKPLMTLKQARQEMVKGSNAIYPFQMLKLTKKVDALTKEAYKQFNSGRHANGDIVTTEDLSGSRYGVSFVKDDESSEDLKVSMMLYHYANIENESYDLLSPYSMYIQKYLGRKDKPNMLKWVKMLDDDLIKGESPTSNLGVYAKYVQALTNYTHWLQLGFNIAGMPFNAFAGFAQSVREIGFRNTLRGLRRVIGSLTVGGGAGVVNAKAISIMEKLHIVSLSKDLEMSVTSKIGKGISKIAFLPVSFVEYINHAYSFIGAMDESEWERVKALPANASAEDYTKAMGGNERVDELHTLTQKINGAYSKYSRRGINKTAEGRALMQFKNWLPDVIFAHLTVSQLNEAGEDLYGEYQSGIATSIKNTVWNKTIIPMFKDKSIAQAKKNWETLSEHEQMQVGKAMRQLVILGGMALWIASLDDRDDKELKRMLKRAMGDVTYIFDVSNMQFLFDNTVPVFGTIKNLLGLVAEVFSTATGNPSVYEKRQGSHMRGDLKLPVMIENQTPVVNKISKLVNEGD